MKSIALTILFLFPILVFGQNDNPYKNCIGVNLMSIGNEGLSMSFRLDKKFGNFPKTKFELSTDTERLIIGRVGIEAFRFGFHDRFYISTGVDLSYLNSGSGRFGFQKFQQVNIEFPIEANFRISNKFTLYGGISFTKSLYSDRQEFNYSSSNKNITIGTKFNF